MKSYEGLFILPPDAAPDAHRQQVKNLDELILKHKGQIQQKTDGGKKTLGYAIQKHSEGHVLVYDFQMDPAQATDFRKALQLQEGLLTFMITVKQIVTAGKKIAKPAAAAMRPAASRPAAPASA